VSRGVQSSPGFGAYRGRAARTIGSQTSFFAHVGRRDLFDRAVVIGRYQPFHDGHRALIVEGLRRVGQACIALRNIQGVDDEGPFDFEYVKSRIEHGLREFEGRFAVASARERRLARAGVIP
jgi:hypothetical protein